MPSFQKRQIIISSKDRQTSELPYNINVNLKNGYNVAEIKFKEFITHHSIMPYDSGDSLYWTIGSAQNAVFTAPASWTGPAIATALQTTLNSVGAAGFTVVYSSLTGKFTITNASSFFLSFHLAGTQNRIWEMLGFKRLTQTSTGTSLTSDFMARSQGISKFFIASTTLARQKAIIGYPASSQGSTPLINNSKSVFMCIPIRVDIGDAIEFNEMNLGEYVFTYGCNYVLENIDIQIVDDYGLFLAVTDEWTLVLEALVIID